MKKNTLLMMLFIAVFSWLGNAQTTTTTWKKANPFAAPDWDNGAPDYTTDAIIDADYLFEDGFIANTLTINAGKTVSIGGTVLAGNAQAIGVVGNFVNNGNIILGGDASFIQYGTMTTGDDATCKVIRETSDYLEYDYIFYSSPTTTATVNSAFVDTAGSSANYVFTLNTSAFNDDNNDMYDDDAEGSEWEVVAPDAALQAGVGYIVLGSHSDLPFDASDINAGTTYNDIVEFTGPFNTGDISVAVTQDNSTTDNSNNLNLLGNPYPSAIDLITFNNDNTDDLNGKFYFWTHNTQLAPVTGYGYVYTNDDYSTFNANVGAGTAAASGGAAPDRYLPSCQSFLAEVKASATEVTFKNTQRNIANNGGFMSPLDEEENDKIWLNMLGDNGDFRQIFVGFFDEATDGFDDFDSIRLENGDNTDFYSVIEGVESHIAIQGAHTFNKDKVIALGLEIVQEGEYTISIDNLEGVFTDGQEIYIYDNATGAIHDLATGDYVFTAAIGEVDDRLELRFKSTVGTDEEALSFLGIYPNPSDAIFNISWRGNSNANIQVYDLSGKVIVSNIVDVVNNTYELDMSAYDTGFYFVELSVDNQKIVKKLVLK